MTTTREDAVRRVLAAVGDPNVPDTCQLWTRTIFGAPSAGDRDHDTDADAVDGWLSEPAWAKHPGDRNPPLGVPVSFSGGSSGHGHRAVVVGPNGQVGGTDTPERGRVGIVDIDWIERNWGLHYLGWSETITGLPIPQEDDMADEATQKTLAEILATAKDAVAEIKGLKSAEADRAKATRKRDAALLALVDDLATAASVEQVRVIAKRIKTLVKEHDAEEAS
jgi:hypothetical protein